MNFPELFHLIAQFIPFISVTVIARFISSVYYDEPGVVVSKMTRARVGQPAFGHGMGSNCSLLHRVQPTLMSTPASYQMSRGSGIKRPGRLTTYIHLASTVRMRGSYTSTSPFYFTSWCLI